MNTRCTINPHCSKDAGHAGMHGNETLARFTRALAGEPAFPAGMQLTQYAHAPVTVTRRIEIDMGHRVTLHASKCKNVHGHRYVIEMTCRAEQLVQRGPSKGMVMDFGFMKDLMMRSIYDPCDHGLVLWAEDPILSVLAPGYVAHIEAQLDGAMQYLTECVTGKLLIVPFVPTAEHLAQHWAHECANALPGVLAEHGVAGANDVHVVQMKVWETPNCSAVYRMDNRWVGLDLSSDA